MANWGTKIETDRCELPTLIPDICERCRYYRYCHRSHQITIEEWLKTVIEEGVKV